VSDATLALSARGIRAGYGERMVLDAVSFEVPAGEVLAIVGPNGAGKSTLLRVLCGSLIPQSGAVELFGRPLPAYDRREFARVVATVAQESTVAFPFTVLEIVLMGRAPHLGAWRFETATDLEIGRRALAAFDILGLAGRHLQELSGGERKLVFLARALAQEPRLVLLDEPTAFLDLRHVSAILAKFRELAATRKLAVVASMHDLNAAALYADRVLLLSNGRTIAHANPDEVLTAENLSRVYETEVRVARNPETGKPMIVPAVASR